MVRTTNPADTECERCGHEGTDVETCGNSWEEEVVVSPGREHPQTGEYMNRETRPRSDGFTADLCASCRDDVDFVDSDSEDDDPDVVTDGGRPLSSYDYAPDVGPSDVDTCYECGRYAPHGFDHAPDCSRFESLDGEHSSRTGASK